MDTLETLEPKQTRQPIDAADADLTGSTFTNVNLSSAIFNDVKLADAKIADANLAGSSFTNVNLAGATFNDVKLTGARIVNVCLGQIHIEDANLSGAAIKQGTSPDLPSPTATPRE